MSRDPVDRSLATWLRDQTTTPTYLDEIVERTRGQRQRPAWSFPERWIPMQLTMRPAYVPRQLFLLVVLALLVAAAAVAFVAIGSSRQTVPPFGLAANGSVAFDRDGRIVITRADGTGASEIVASIPDARGPVYSPDGERLAFYATVDGRDAVMVSGADGRNAVPVSAGVDLGSLAMETPPSWSPDSTQLVFGGVVGERQAIFVAASDGSAVEEVGGSDLFRIDPAWSPDGQWIAFHGYRPEEAAAAPQHQTIAGLYVVRPDGTGQRSLVTGEGGDFIYRKPQWLPDPSRLVLAYAVGKPNMYDIALYDIDGQREVRFPAHWSAELWPAWSPDGSELAWLGSDAHLHFGRPDGTLLPDRPSPIDYELVWSPDGDYLLGWSNEAREQLVIAPRDGSAEPVRIPVDGESRSHWSWQRRAP